MRVGNWVEVRSKEEILATLDKNGRLDGMPFMPQMFGYSGQSFKVFKVAHKTCDTVNNSGGRRLAQGIHLDLRCNGKTYGNCQAACLIFWKEAWLKPVVDPAEAKGSAQLQDGFRLDTTADPQSRCSEKDVWQATSTENAGIRSYQCQAVRLPYFTEPLPWWRLDQYVMDYNSGNAPLGKLFNGLVYSIYCKVTRAYHEAIGRPGRWFYDRFQEFIGGVPYPRRRGTLPAKENAPIVTLDLKPNELVRVKSYGEILATLRPDNTHLGLFFDAEMVPYCGGTYRVKTRVEQFVDEKTGILRSLKTPAVILEDVWCQSCYSNKRMFCPRSIYSWWREAWLERVEEGEPATGPYAHGMPARPHGAA